MYSISENYTCIKVQYLSLVWICRAQTGGSGQQCCYDNQGVLVTGPPGGGTVNRVSPDVSFVRHFTSDVIPFLLCCKAGIFSNCDEYYRLRPSDTGTQFDPPTPG